MSAVQTMIFVILAAVDIGIGFIPAIFAKKKGYSFGLFLFLGFVFPFALVIIINLTLPWLAFYYSIIGTVFTYIPILIIALSLPDLTNKQSLFYGESGRLSLVDFTSSQADSGVQAAFEKIKERYRNNNPA